MTHFSRHIKLFFKISGISMTMAMLVAPLFAGAEPLPYWGGNPPLLPCGSGGNLCTNLCQLVELGDHVTSFGITLAVFALGPAFFAYGGIMVMIARGSEQRLSLGKNILTSALIGMVIALGAYVIIETFFTLIGATVGASGGWANIQCFAR